MSLVAVTPPYTPEPPELIEQLIHPTTYTVGSFLGYRLKELGVDHLFSVPGDYNMVLLDELKKSVSLISCCNELNAGMSSLLTFYVELSKDTRRMDTHVLKELAQQQ